jgi:hypothetical protein
LRWILSQLQGDQNDALKVADVTVDSSPSLFSFQLYGAGMHTNVRVLFLHSRLQFGQLASNLGVSCVSTKVTFRAVLRFSLMGMQLVVHSQFQLKRAISQVFCQLSRKKVMNVATAS